MMRLEPNPWVKPIQTWSTEMVWPRERRPLRWWEEILEYLAALYR